ncbi:helix-turn-helix domain-containing protein [Nocardia nova]|uniref:helix-turn-helix domain-containing protein n=1 Tax=Nocardia nova TaxID=37330 RepID=UPI0033E97FFE
MYSTTDTFHISDAVGSSTAGKDDRRVNRSRGHSGNTHPPRRTRRTRATQHIEMPNLAHWLDALRHARTWSREIAARNSGISTSYLTRLEREQLAPTIDTLAKIVHSYRLDLDQRRHTYDLWTPPRPLPTVEELRRLIVTPDRAESIAQLDSADVMSVYTTPLSTVLTASDRLYHGLTGLRDADDNLALWFFQPPARDLVVDWDREAIHVVAGIRAALAPYRSSVEARALFRTLASNPDFNHIWTTHSTAVAYGRRSATPIQLRTNRSHEPISMTIQITEFSDPHGIAAYGLNHAPISCS